MVGRLQVNLSAQLKVAYCYYQTWIPNIDGHTCVDYTCEYAAPPGLRVPSYIRHGVHGLPFVYRFDEVVFTLGVN